MSFDAKILVMFLALIAGFVICVDSCNKSPASSLNCANACRDKMESFDHKSGVCKCK